MSERHPTLEEMVEHLLAGGLPAAIATHADGCGSCTERAELARRLTDAASLADIAPPTDTLVDGAWRMIARARALDRAVAALAGAKTLIGRVVASLAGDSAIPSHATRGQSTAHARVLVYETDQLGISIALDEPTENGVALRGQITPRDRDDLPAGRHAVVVADGVTRETAIDDFGAFDLGVVPNETLHVAFTVGTMRVDLPPLVPGGTE